MIIYIAASWRHQHLVVLLTAQLRARGHHVNSFVENNHGEGAGPDNADFEGWVHSNQAGRCFQYDTTNAMGASCVIYIGGSGMDAAAECGMAYASGTPILGLWQKGDGFGLMRRMLKVWRNSVEQLLLDVDLLAKEQEATANA